MVGASLLKVLEEYKFEFDEFIPVASENCREVSIFIRKRI